MLSIYVSFPLAGVTWAIFLLERIAIDVQRIRGIEPEASEEVSQEASS